MSKKIAETTITKQFFEIKGQQPDAVPLFCAGNLCEISPKKKPVFFVFLFFFTFSLTAQNFTVSGFITDHNTGETLINATVFDMVSAQGVVSNAFGFYSLTIPAGEVQIRYSFIGFETQILSFRLTQDTVINIRMSADNLLDEVTVVGHRRDLGVFGAQVSAVEVPITQIQSIPSLFGETDLIKALQLLPGVQGGAEGFAGFHVRGGGADENLFLLDGIPIYNINRMGGFFSVFNTDASKNVTLYKGGFPARFGGRTSSVLDIRMNDGNNQRLAGNVSVGLISSRINLEGPVFSENTTFNISARRTYFDLLARPVLWVMQGRDDMDRLRAGYYFYDLNAKLSHRFSDRDRIFFSFYLGDDVIYANIGERRGDYTDRTLMDWNWGNLVTAVRWNRLINNRLFMNATTALTRYRFNLDMGFHSEWTNSEGNRLILEQISLGYNSGITDYMVKIDFDFMPNPNHDIKFGFGYTNHTFRPGISAFSLENGAGSNIDTIFGDQNIRAHATALYIENNITVGRLVRANVGLHYATFFVQNRFYHSLQPRLSARMLLSNNLSFKVGYAYMNQFVHLLSNSAISLPTDLWVPVTRQIAPLESHQISAGFFYNFRNLIDFSVEGYYKRMNNLIEYREGASFLGSTAGWEEQVVSGRGWAYGIEFLAQKTVGRTTGWIGYTWSKTRRLFDRPGQELNFGQVFPARFDRRHDFNLVVSHRFNDRIDVSGTWVFSSGNWGTLAMQHYQPGQVPGAGWGLFPPRAPSLEFIEHRNNFQLPNYHRLDLGVNFHRQLRRGMRTWNISVYNAYNQMNPFLVRRGHENGKPVLKKVTIFPILPSVSYSFRF